MYRHRAAAACGCAGGHYRVATRRLQPEADGRSRARQRNADGRGADASVCYRKTLYLDPRHYEALTHLATLLELQGDHAGAHLLSERAARANSVRIAHNR